MIVLDASVLIAYLDAGDIHHDAAVELLSRAADNELGVSQLTLAEILLGPARKGRLELVLKALEDLEVEELTLPADGAARLARLRVTTNLKLPDCCVLLAAEAAAAGVASFDERLVEAAANRGLTVDP